MFGPTKVSAKFSPLSASVFLIVFAGVSLWGVFDCTNPLMQSRMEMSGHQAPADCVPGQDCGMDLNTHLSIWQAAFTADLSFNPLRSLKLLAVAVLWGAATGIFTISLSLLSTQLVSYFYYKRHSFESKLYNYFLQIFARGILQPKLYA